MSADILSKLFRLCAKLSGSKPAVCTGNVTGSQEIMMSLQRLQQPGLAINESSTTNDLSQAASIEELSCPSCIESYEKTYCGRC